MPPLERSVPNKSTEFRQAGGSAAKRSAPPIAQLPQAPPRDLRQAATKAKLSRWQRLRLAAGIGQERAGARRDTVSRRLLALADVTAATFALLIVTALGNDQIAPASVVLIPLVVGLSKILGLYDRDELLLHKATLREAPGLFQLATLYAIAAWLLESFVFIGALEKIQFVALWLAVFTMTLVGRGLVRQLAPSLTPPERCLVVGNSQAYGRIAEKLQLTRPRTAQLVLRVGADRIEELTAGRLGELVESHHIERVIVVPGMIDSDVVLDLIREAKSLGIKVSLLPRFSEVLGSSMVFDDLHGMTMLAVERFGLSRSSQVLKRGFDIVAAGMGVMVLMPLLLVIALALTIEARQPIFFRQRRIGRDGKSFEMLKFRTMVPNADELKAQLSDRNEAQGLFKITDDPRHTTVGRWLRRTSLDELPQLINVLRGNMSLVGPRPLVPEEDEQIEGWYRARLNLAPGMTGHWQVLGSSRVPLHEMIAIDYLYVANWSLWKDIEYLLRTVPHVVNARGL
jgi:exopolysaccharide biosynthesis polyprenyl glycosylphosphotransferase